MTENDPAAGRARTHVLFALVLAMAAVTLCWDLGRPWVGKHEGWNGAVWSLAARSQLQYGFAATRLGAITNGDRARPQDFVYYVNHPPLLPLALAVSFTMLGEHEWSARLVMVLASLGSLVLVYLLGIELGGPLLGLLSAFLLAFIPMSAFYGRMVDHEAPTGFLALLVVLLYLRWTRSRRGALLAGSVVALALGLATGWPAYYLAGLLPAHHLLFPGGGRRDARVLVFPVVAVAMFALFLAHVGLLKGGVGLRELADMFVTRTGAGTADYHEGAAETFTWAGFLLLWAKRAPGLFTLPVLLAAAFGLVGIARAPRDPGSGTRALVVLLLVFGLTHVLLFRQGAWVHEYWGYYLSAPLALLAAGGVLSLTRGEPNGRVTLLFALLFLAAAGPRLVTLHGAEDVNVLDQCRVVAAHTLPGELVCMNEGFVKPQVSYYARRDVHEAPVRTVAELQEVVAGRRPRPLALLVLEGAPGASELEAWLGSRYAGEDAAQGARRYRIYRIPGRR